MTLSPTYLLAFFLMLNSINLQADFNLPVKTLSLKRTYLQKQNKEEQFYLKQQKNQHFFLSASQQEKEPLFTLKLKRKNEQYPLSSSVYRLYYDKLPLCRAFYQEVEVLGQKTPLVTALLPELRHHTVISLEDKKQSFEELESKLQALLNEQTIELRPEKNRRSCLWAQGSFFLELFHSEIIKDQRKYEVFWDEKEVYLLNPLFFEALAKIQSYKLNPLDQELITEEFELIGNGFLESKYFQIEPALGKKAQSENHQFIFSPESEYFPEANLFAGASRMLAWFQSFGFNWYTSKALVLKQTLDSPLYTPASSSSDSPVIDIGFGDGAKLRNLYLDQDVIYHEFSHHVIYRHLEDAYYQEEGSNKNHSLALHEGLADYFAMAKSESANLGESICPGTSEAPLCYKKGEYLRTAENDLSYLSETYLQLTTHQKGQLVSGFLWDLRKESSSKTDFDRFVYESLILLPSYTATYQDLICSLLSLDSMLYQSSLQAKIIAFAEKRAFTQEVKAAQKDCIYQVKPQAKTHLCGSFPSPLSQTKSWPLLGFFFFFPLLLGCRRKRL